MGVATTQRRERRPQPAAIVAHAPLRVGAVDDPAEREADDIAAGVIASLDSGTPALLRRRVAAPDTRIRRKVWSNDKFAQETNAGALTQKSSAQRQIETRLKAYRTTYEDDATGAVDDA